MERHSSSAGPSPRVGSTSVIINGKIYLFSGRGGEDMVPFEGERGTIWAFDTITSVWSQISLVTSGDDQDIFPPARSYHCSTTDGKSCFYVHAGCAASGRLSDFWMWHTVSRIWKPLPDAPGPARGGASITFHNGLLYRMNGFDGKTEQGGNIDVFSSTDSSWSSIPFKADGISGPLPRSVSTLLPLTVNGKSVLVTMFGEADPSSQGHAGAGRMLDDIWVYDIQDALWQRVEIKGTTNPIPRGWFDAAVTGEGSIIISGGLGESNERLDDAWLLSF